jgi:hypothetical protein
LQRLDASCASRELGMLLRQTYRRPKISSTTPLSPTRKRSYSLLNSEKTILMPLTKQRRRRTSQLKRRNASNRKRSNANVNYQGRSRNFETKPKTWLRSSSSQQKMDLALNASQKILSRKHVLQKTSDALASLRILHPCQQK